MEYKYINCDQHGRVFCAMGETMVATAAPTTGTKVEELRTAVKTIISVPSLICGDPVDKGSMALVDDLISAVDADAFVRGKAEGAAEERESIRKWLYEPDPANFGQLIHVNVLGELEFIMLSDLLSVLAPKGVIHTKILYPPDEAKP